MGDAFLRLHRFEEAETALRRAIEIGDETIHAAAGAFRGSLAFLLAQRDEFEEALTLLKKGETQVKSEPGEHAKFLCKKGQFHLLAGDPSAAQTALGRAEALVGKMNRSEMSDIGRALKGLAEALGDIASTT